MSSKYNCLTNSKKFVTTVKLVNISIVAQARADSLQVYYAALR